MVAIIGVLVAISIPIFSSQLKKARLATNQANARAAYAAATTQTASTGKAVADTTAKTADLSNTDISSWKITDQSASTQLGDKTASEWTVVLDQNGTVTGYLAAFK